VSLTGSELPKMTVIGSSSLIELLKVLLNHSLTKEICIYAEEGRILL